MSKLFHNIKHFSYHFRIESGSRLVKKHNLRLHCESTYDCDALFLTAGELDWKRVCTIFKTDPVEKIQGFLFSFLPGNSFHLHRSKSHVVENGLMRKQIKVLEYHSHFLTQLIDIELYCFSFGIFIFFLCDINAVENDRPPSRFFQQVQ